MLEEIVKKIKSVRLRNAQVFVMGNGGSSANAEHFTNDLFSKGVRAHCLSSNTSIITMIANDFGYDKIFSHQLEVYANVGDILILISCSGTSENILEAVDLAEHMPLEIVKIFGGKGTYGEMESEHLAMLHKIAEAI